MDFRPLATEEREKLMKALRGNANGRAILTDAKDTSFRGMADDVDDEGVITAIKSVPCHYGE